MEDVVAAIDIEEATLQTSVVLTLKAKKVNNYATEQLITQNVGGINFDKLMAYFAFFCVLFCR